MLIALIFGLLVCNIWLKPAVARIRPYDFQENLGVIVNLLIEKQHDFAFPSGHTIASFEAAVVILLNNKKLGIPAMILACLIAFSRLYLYVHYPTDVICSIILGTAFAFLGNWLAQKVMDKLPEKLK
jgi:undecaprenyl-diphosphatase